jgi:hypothetical protein
VAIQLGGDVGSVVAVSPAALGTLARGFPDDDDRDRAAASLVSSKPAPELPPGTGRVEVVLEAVGLAAPPEVTLLVADPSGALREVQLRPTSDLTYAAPLPPDTSGIAAPWTIAALDLEVSAGGHRSPRVGLVSIAADVVVLDDETWTAQAPGGPELSLTPGRAAPSGDVEVAPELRAIRLTPSFAPGTADGRAVPVVLSATAAERLDLDAGDEMELSLDGTYERLQTEVAQVVPAVPGAPDESAVLIDLRAVEQALLHDQEVVSPPSDLWIATDEPDAVAAGLRQLLPANSRIDTAADRAGRSVLATGSVAWWLASAGCGLLALLTLGIVASGQLRSRRGDVVVLRALGLSAREQRRLRGRELGWTVAFGLVAGAVAGVAVAFLVVPQLARAAVPEPYPTIATGLGVEVPGLLLGALLLVGGLATGIARSGRRVGREAGRAGGPVGDL